MSTGSAVHARSAPEVAPAAASTLHAGVEGLTSLHCFYNQHNKALGVHVVTCNQETPVGPSNSCNAPLNKVLNPWNITVCSDAPAACPPARPWPASSALRQACRKTSLLARRDWRILHAEPLQPVVQRLQQHAEPGSVPRQQRAFVGNRADAQPRHACPAVQQHRRLAQLACSMNIDQFNTACTAHNHQLRCVHSARLYFHAHGQYMV